MQVFFLRKKCCLKSCKLKTKKKMGFVLFCGLLFFYFCFLLILSSFDVRKIFKLTKQ